MAVASKATQEFVPIKEVRDGVITLKDGSMRGILLASSINFSLKSEDERNAIVMQFQDFLNSLDFNIQISIDVKEGVNVLGRQFLPKNEKKKKER